MTRKVQIMSDIVGLDDGKVMAHEIDSLSCVRQEKSFQELIFERTMTLEDLERSRYCTFILRHRSTVSI